jgi:hypothetical protein
MLAAMFMFALMGTIISYEDDDLVKGLLFAFIFMLACILGVSMWATGGVE